MGSNMTWGKRGISKISSVSQEAWLKTIGNVLCSMKESYILDITLLMGKIDWIKPHLAKEGKTVFETSAELISTLIPNDSKLSLASTQAVVLSMATEWQLKKVHRCILENKSVSSITKVKSCYVSSKAPHFGKRKNRGLKTNKNMTERSFITFSFATNIEHH